MADQREQEMLELMRECSMTLRRCENTLNEVWAEWTRTHGLRGGVSQPLEKADPNAPFFEKPADDDALTVRSMDGKVVRRVLKK